MISFEEDSRGLNLLFEVEFNDPEWVSKRLKDDGQAVTVTVHSICQLVVTGEPFRPKKTARGIG
jgi:hypothetical protein